MQSKGNQPNASQKRWREAVRDTGSVVSTSSNPVIVHHCAGATAKHNKIPIGHEFILPLTQEEHLGLHSGNLGDNRKEFEKGHFELILDRLEGHTDMPSDEVIEAIRDYHI